MDTKTPGVLKEFKDFIIQGDVIMLAVAVVIGLAFNAVVKAFVTDILTPILGIFGNTNFQTLTFTIHGSTFLYGDVLNYVITFVSIGAAVFFLVVKPYNAITARTTRTTEPTDRACPACLTHVPIAATRCSACTSDLPPVEPGAAT